MTELLEKLLVRGLNAVIVKSEYQDLKRELLSECPDVLEARLSEVDAGIQMKIVEGMVSNRPDAFKDDFWSSYVDKALSHFDNATDKYVHENGSWFVLLNTIKNNLIGKEVDWLEIMDKLSSATAEVGIKAPGFTTVLEWLIASDKLNLRNLLYKTETKKYPRHLKVSLYKKLVEFGLLDEKIARRIRSDTSGQLSVEVLSFLFENRNLYTDDDFQNLITKFADTKHKWVARFIAVNMPYNLIPFLLALDDKFAVEILEKRMNTGEDHG